MPPKTRYSDKLSPVPVSGFMAPPGKKRATTAAKPKPKPKPKPVVKPSTNKSKPPTVTTRARATAKDLESAAKMLMRISKTMKKPVKKT